MIILVRKDIDKNLYQEYVIDKMSIQDLCRKYHADSNTIRRHLNKIGITEFRPTSEYLKGRTRSPDVVERAEKARYDVMKSKYGPASDITKQRMSDTQKRVWSDPEMRKQQSNRLTIIWKDENLRKQQSERQKIIQRDPIMRANHPSGKDHPCYGKKATEEERKRHSIRAKKQWEDPKYRLIQNNTWLNGRSLPIGRGKGGYFITPDGTKIWLRSSYETRVANILTLLNISWKYESKTFDLDYTVYRPDFLINDKLWWEVKGYIQPKAQEKLLKFFDLYPKENIKIIRLSDIENMERCITNNIEIDISTIGNKSIENE